MFKKIIFIFFILFSVNFVFEAQANESLQDAREIFILPDGSPNPNLAALLDLEGLYDPADRLAEMVKKTQRCWIAVQQGRGEKERVDLVDSPERVRIREKVIAIAKEMGLFQGSKPRHERYRYAVCHGSFLSGVRLHLFQLVNEWKQGIRFDSLVFLTGERYLRKGAGEEDDFAKLLDAKASLLPLKSTWIPPSLDQICYQTEYDMVKLVWEQVQLPLEMAAALEGKVLFVNALKGNAARPSTADTFRFWLQCFHPQPETILAPSYPLLWRYQQLTGLRILGPGFQLDTIAQPVTGEELDKYRHSIVTLIFDTVAKCLYEIDLIDKNKCS